MLTIDSIPQCNKTYETIPYHHSILRVASAPKLPLCGESIQCCSCSSWHARAFNELEQVLLRRRLYSYISTKVTAM